MKARGRQLTINADLYEGWRVSSIATPREAFVSCTPSERMADVVERNTEKFDFMPVLSGENTVLGVVELAGYFNAPAPPGLVSEFLVTLGERHLIGADASILAFIMNADKLRFRFVVSRKGIVGLVGLPDLQKLAVRATLFSLVTELELFMLEAIRSAFPWSHCSFTSRNGRHSLMCASHYRESYRKSGCEGLKKVGQPLC